MLRQIGGAVLALIGAVVGGFIGYVIFNWLIGQGYYGLMIPGAFLGLGCSLFATRRSMVRGLLCGFAALGLGLFCEWKRFPFAADESFGYMVKHLGDKGQVTIIMLVVGSLLSFWIGKDSGYASLTRRSASSPRKGED